MDGMWHLNAPQWTDFESSPQIPDEDYFEREHEELEPQPLKKDTEPVASINQPLQKNELKLKNVLLEDPVKQDSLVNEIEIAKMTPIKIISPKSKNKNYNKPKELTYDNVLSEAMASLQLSVKKNSKRSLNPRNTMSNLTSTPRTADKIVVAKSLNLNKGPRSTPSNPIPMWIRKTRPSENNVNENKNITILSNNEAAQELEKHNNPMPQDVLEKQDPEIDERILTTESKKPVDISNKSDNQDLDSNGQQKASEDLSKHDAEVDVSVLEDTAPSSSSTLLPESSKRSSNTSQASGFSNKGQRARFSTCQIRRRSLTQYRRRSNKFISLAEAINKFQNKTPVRFRSMSTKNLKPGPLHKIQQSTISATVPISPALKSKSRTRPAVLSHEERERLEMEEIRKHSIRENLARSNSLQTLSRNSSSKIAAKKPPIVRASSSQAMEAKNSNPKAKHEAKTKVTVLSVVSTKEGMALQDAEIANFGVPDITLAKPVSTKVMPFSFETRNKEMQKKKEKKIKELMTEEEKKRNVSFHARPVPTFKKPMLVMSKELGAVKPKTKPCPFSFEERDKNSLKKKENFIKTVIEEDKKARIFQAKPLPEFKPVLVRGASKENINTGNRTATAPPQKTRISMLPVARTGSRNCLLVKANVSNQENQNPYTKLERSKSVEIRTESQLPSSKTKVLTEFHLNTDKRAKERKEFDERIKQKEQEIELLKKEAEVEKIKRDETERAEIRKMAEIKARPMPAYKLPAVIHSDKPLTEPQSPGWSTKPKR